MKASIRCVGSTFLRCECCDSVNSFRSATCADLSAAVRTGEKIGYMEWKAAIMAETGGDFLLMLASLHYQWPISLSSNDYPQREDLIQMLYQLAVAAGTRVDLQNTVVAIQPGAPKPTVLLENGDTITADIVVGVDGDLAVGILDRDAVVRDTVAGGHGEVGDGGSDGDQGGDDVVETLADGDIPGQQGEDADDR